MVPPEGRRAEDGDGQAPWIHTDGTRVERGEGMPEESKPEAIIAVANAIKDMRAMTKFDISSNNFRAEGGKALAAGLKGNQVITELNISDNNWVLTPTSMLIPLVLPLLPMPFPIWGP
jgi:hypothetical protein